MIQFIKDAIREFKHVVWPTRKETQKYFSLVLGMLIFFGIYLFIASNIFSEIIFGLKDALGTNTPVENASGITDEELDALMSGEATIVTAETEQASASGTTTETTTETPAAGEAEETQTGTTDEATQAAATSTGEIAQ